MRLTRKALVAGSISGVLLLGQLAAANGAYASDVDESLTDSTVPPMSQLQILPEAVTGVSTQSLSGASVALAGLELTFSTAGKAAGTVTVEERSAAGIEVTLVATSAGEPSKTV